MNAQQAFEVLTRSAAAAPVSFREFAESPAYCNLRLSPLAAKIAEDSASTTIRTVAVRAGGRGGKTSRLLAPKALHAAWTVPLPTLQPGEAGISLIVAPDRELARQALSFVKGYVEQSPILSMALVTEPTVDAVTLRRPDGKVVRVQVLPATRGGRAVRARTLVFAGMDEAAFFYAEGTGVVNDQDIYDAVFQRVVPGGQVWVVSTPWLKGIGLLEDLIDEPSPTVLAVTASTRELNPTWDPDGTIEREMRAKDPEKAAREIDGVPMSGGVYVFFEDASIEASIDKTLTLPRVPQPREEVCAAADAGFRRNSSAGCVTHRKGRRILVGDLFEKRPEPGKPLKPSVVLRDFALRFKGHAGCSYVVADGHYREAVAEVLSDHDLSFKDAPLDVSEPYIKTRTMMREGRLAIPNDPKLIAQLRSVRWRANAGGSVSIILPQERSGEHCDLVSVLVLAVWESAGLEVPDEPAKPGTREYGILLEDRMEAAIDEEMAREEREQWEARQALGW